MRRAIARLLQEPRAGDSGARRRAGRLASTPMRLRQATGILAAMHPRLHMQLARTIIDERLRVAKAREEQPRHRRKHVGGATSPGSHETRGTLVPARTPMRASTRIAPRTSKSPNSRLAVKLGRGASDRLVSAPRRWFVTSGRMSVAARNKAMRRRLWPRSPRRPGSAFMTAASWGASDRLEGLRQLKPAGEGCDFAVRLFLQRPVDRFDSGLKLDQHPDRVGRHAAIVD